MKDTDKSLEDIKLRAKKGMHLRVLQVMWIFFRPMSDLNNSNDILLESFMLNLCLNMINVISFCFKIRLLLPVGEVVTKADKVAQHSRKRTIRHQAAKEMEVSDTLTIGMMLMCGSVAEMSLHVLTYML